MPQEFFISNSLLKLSELSAPLKWQPKAQFFTETTKTDIKANKKIKNVVTPWMMPKTFNFNFQQWEVTF